MMRLTSDFVVGALLRRVEAEGAYATVARRGDETAGAIFVLVDGLAGTVALYGPAPPLESQTRPSLDPALTGNRLFCDMPLRPQPTRQAAEAVLAQEMKFDPDLWIIDIEDRQMRSFVPVI